MKQLQQIPMYHEMAGRLVLICAPLPEREMIAVWLVWNLHAGLGSGFGRPARNGEGGRSNGWNADPTYTLGTLEETKEALHVVRTN
jgi:hypothetical protein